MDIDTHFLACNNYLSEDFDHETIYKQPLKQQWRNENVTRSEITWYICMFLAHTAI